MKFTVWATWARAAMAILLKYPTFEAKAHPAHLRTTSLNWPMVPVMWFAPHPFWAETQVFGCECKSINQQNCI
jgi:hypothetical protein